jgi:ketosteroid isomerase-like protein
MNMGRFNKPGLCAFVMLTLIASCGKINTGDVEKTIIDKERQIMDEWGKGHTMVFPSNSSREITYFDPSLGKRLDGIRAFSELCKSVEGKFTIDKYEMVDPRVQVYGDVAVLTYNLVDYSKKPDGAEQKFFWNSTEVYHREGSGWRIVHSHWSFTKPNIAQPN